MVDPHRFQSHLRYSHLGVFIFICNKWLFLDILTGSFIYHSLQIIKHVCRAVEMVDALEVVALSPRPSHCLLTSSQNSEQIVI